MQGHCVRQISDRGLMRTGSEWPGASSVRKATGQAMQKFAPAEAPGTWDAGTWWQDSPRFGRKVGLRYRMPAISAEVPGRMRGVGRCLERGIGRPNTGPTRGLLVHKKISKNNREPTVRWMGHRVDTPILVLPATCIKYSKQAAPGGVAGRGSDAVKHGGVGLLDGNCPPEVLDRDSGTYPETGISLTKGVGQP